MAEAMRVSATTTRSNPSGCKTLAVGPPSKRIRPETPRELSQLNPNLKHVLRDLCKGRRPWPLLLHGGAGRGKTCAALLLADRVNNSFYWTVDFLMGFAFDLQASIWHYSARADLVIVDELGTRVAEHDREYCAVKHIADLREHKPTIWISNLLPRELQTIYDDRILSRIGSGTVIELTGEDRRRARGKR